MGGSQKARSSERVGYGALSKVLVVLLRRGPISLFVQMAPKKEQTGPKAGFIP